MKRICSIILVISILALTCLTSVAEPKYAYGDPNHDNAVNSADALLVLKTAVNKYKPTAEQFLLADVNADGLVNSSDALLILKYAVKKIKAFPVESMSPEERYYSALDEEYGATYSDFTQDTAIKDFNDPKEIVEKLGGDPKIAPAKNTATDDLAHLKYTPISDEAAAQGKLSKYKTSKVTRGSITLGKTKVEFSVPKNATAYDAVPINYTVTTESIHPVHLEATAFEDVTRYESVSNAYYDCNLPGRVAVDMSYEGYVIGTNNGIKPALDPYAKKDVQAASYPSINVSDLTRSGTLKAGQYTWFKFSFKNTGNTILDGEGNSTFRFRPRLYRKNGSAWEYIAGTPNEYYPLLDYVYPGETGEMWVLFNMGGNNFGVPAGEYQIRIEGCMRNEKSSYNYGAMQLAGDAITTSTFSFKVTAAGALTDPADMTETAPKTAKRNGWLANFEEFLSSYNTMAGIDGKTSGTMYVQVAPWTRNIVLKVIHGDEQGISSARVGIDVESDSISLTLNPYNENYHIKDDGTRTPLILAQNMVDMRGNIDRGPYLAQTIVNDLRNMKEAGINYITTTEGASGDFTGFYDMTYFMLDCARDMDFEYETGCLYPYRTTLATSRLSKSGCTEDLGTRRDISNQRSLDAANGVIAKLNLIRYGDFAHVMSNGTVPISIEENFGWLTYGLGIRYYLNSGNIDRLLYTWLKSAYSNDISALNKKYNSSYTDFNKISVNSEATINGDGTATLNNISGVYHDWNAATIELDLFRTVERAEGYKEMLAHSGTNNGKVAVRSENSVFLAPGIKQTTQNAHYRSVYYEQRRAALVPEILAASGAFTADSSYCWIPFTNREVYEMTRVAAKSGLTIMKTPSFNHMQDVVANDYVGSRSYADALCLDYDQTACMVHRSSSLFNFWKSIYEAGGVPGTMWMDYACDLYVTSTQYKEMLFFKQKVEEMLQTEEGKEWAKNVPTQPDPLKDLAVGAYSYKKTFIDQQIADLPRINLIMDFCSKN